jgi:hypothetical protein
MAPQPTTPARTVGIPRGETFNRYADDATGINVPDRKPIDSRMPSMPPA